MSDIPFLYINVAVLSCFALMFVTILAVKKTPEIWAFLAVLLDAILWAGGSVLMRLQVWPGLSFWYKVSLLALFIMELLFYIFVHTFAHRKGRFLVTAFVLWNLAIIPGTLSGFFLSPPTPVVLENGDTVFTYSLNWHIVIPCIMFIAIIAGTAVLLWQVMREQGTHSPGIQVIVIGGLVFAVLLMVALYKRRMFRMTLVASRSLLSVAMAAICLTFAANLIEPMRAFVEGRLGVEEDWAIMAVAVAFAGVLVLAYILIRRLLDAVFTREEQQNKLVKRFTGEISQSLSTADIMDKLSTVISSEIPTEQIYVCLLEGDVYQARFCSSPLATLSFSFSKDSPQIAYLKEQESYLILREFRNSPPLPLLVGDGKGAFPPAEHRLRGGHAGRQRDRGSGTAFRQGAGAGLQCRGDRLFGDGVLHRVHCHEERGAVRADVPGGPDRLPDGCIQLPLLCGKAGRAVPPVRPGVPDAFVH